jgi:hypothetical protein
LPPALRAATGTEIVLNLLRSPDAAERLAGIEAVTCETCDADGLLAVWALLHPEPALHRAHRITAAARAGAFGVWDEDEAAQFVCWVINYPEDLGITDPAEAIHTLLPQVPGMLDRPRDHDLYWIGEYSDVITADAMFRSGAVEVEEHPTIDLAVLHTPLRLHDLVRFRPSVMSRHLTVRAENTYIVEYRRESWTPYPDRRVPPRIDLRPLAARLNLFERNPGHWRAEPVSERKPRLFLDRGDGRSAPSSLDAETAIAEVVDYLTANATKEDLLWTPFGPAREG